MNTPILIHIPHSSKFIPKEQQFLISKSTLRKELMIMTDHFCDEIFYHPTPMIIAKVSRLVCDTERFRDDTQEEMSKQGMGAIYTRCSDGTLLRNLTEKQRETILSRYYDPHHRMLTETVTEILEKQGQCLIIDGHSFHPLPLPHEPDQSNDRPDICIGIDSYHTPKILIKETAEFFRKKGLKVKINSPFKGSMVPMKYYEKNPKVMSIMIEINRKLYCDKQGEKTLGFFTIKNIIKEYLNDFNQDN